MRINRVPTAVELQVGVLQLLDDQGRDAAVHGFLVGGSGETRLWVTTLLHTKPRRLMQLFHSSFRETVLGTPVAVTLMRSSRSRPEFATVGKYYFATLAK